MLLRPNKMHEARGRRIITAADGSSLQAWLRVFPTQKDECALTDSSLRTGTPQAPAQWSSGAAPHHRLQNKRGQERAA